METLIFSTMASWVKLFAYMAVFCMIYLPILLAIDMFFSDPVQYAYAVAQFSQLGTQAGRSQVSPTPAVARTDDLALPSNSGINGMDQYLPGI